jgi:PAS domain S-box-containing protein
MADDPEPPVKPSAAQLSGQQISAILAIAADAIISLDDNFRINLFNEGAATIFGYAPAEIIGKPLELLIPTRMRSKHHRHVAEFSSSPVAARKMGDRQEIFALRKDGTEFPAEASIAKQVSEGRLVYMVVLRDVTERKAAEAALAQANADLETRVAERTRELEAEIMRREETQAALIQSQRLEAIGQLTGGVAHDFNNLLTIITGNLELLAGEIETPALQDFVKRAADAADMGASLTRRLLTFARRRRLTPEVIDVNALILDLTEILKRSLGETITLTTVLAGNLWPTRADPSELENAILNLSINARDAMSAGGSLLIETRNALGDAAGLRSGVEYVLISVSDTGHGMADDVTERAFEPFFTTKESGRGTGLGLSTVYGFAEQSGGHAEIVSEIGRGTTVKLYLPRADGASVADTFDERGPVPMAENAETVLVVEDNPDVRELALQRVEGLGYVALEAESGASALRILEGGTAIDVVLSDIVMPGGISGYDLARWIRANKPPVRIVLTSGYAAEETRRDPIEETGQKILRKPYKRLELAVALRDALKR